MVRKVKKRKSARKKTAKKAVKKKALKKAPKKQENMLFFVGVGVLVVLLVVVGTYSYFQDRPVVAQSNDVLVTVNGKQLTQSQLDFQYNLLPAAYRLQLTKEEVLQQIVDEELIIQEAERSGVVVGPAEVNERVQQILEDSGLTIGDLQKNLAFFNVTMEEFEELVARQIKLRQYTEEHIVVEEPTTGELRSLYDLSKSKYAFDEQATVRHVLISSQRSDAAVVAKQVYDMAREGDDFCKLVSNYTDDKGGRETCGEYTFPRGVMVPEFEEASFEMSDGDFRLVQTIFGYHIIYRVGITPPGVREFDDVRDELVAEFKGADYSKQREALLVKLREDATIVYSGTEEMVEVVIPEPPVVEEVPVVEPPVVKKQMMKEPEMVEVVVETTVLDCIAEKATLYGTSWSTDTQEARDLFADTELDYVGCESQEALCQSKGIEAFPTWIIDDQIFLGRMPVERLKLATGC